MPLPIKLQALLVLLPAVSLASPTHGNRGSDSLPKVDLGYEIYKANSLNDTTGLYSFSNIRYAAPPTGENRFRAPQPPAQNRSAVQSERESPVCPQADPLWNAISAEFVPQYILGGGSFNASSFEAQQLPPGVNAGNINLATFNTSIIPPAAPGTTEDCLFLDVVVPQKIFEAKRQHDHGAAVLVWIYGGGYTAGSKTGDSYNPTGLLARSQADGGDGVIYVALNYRLGAFGFSSGPTFQEDGAANAGLLDQRFALEWVQEHISKFGGDPKRVTVFGESAGGGSIMHQLTAYAGNKGCAPFSQAIIQSPGFLPMPSRNQQEQIFQDYLRLLNVSSLEEARRLPTAALQLANAIQVGLSTYGTFTYGPVVDGNFAPALPGEALLHGNFDKSVKVMVGHNTNEALLFTSPFIDNSTDIQQYLSTTIPSIAAYPNVLSYITSTLYPPVFDGSQAQSYTDSVGRASALTAELSFTCNTFYLDTAYHNNTYSYLFSVPPALHGMDVRYTFYVEGETSDDEFLGVPNPVIAVGLQEYITNFAMKGDPNQQGVGLPVFDMYGKDATVQNLNITGITQTRDPAANYRCDWWQKALYS